MNIFYWSPFLSQIATISSVTRSAESITNYSKKKHSISIIDSVGEWENYNNLKNINFIKLYKKSFYNNLPKGGFLKSRLSQLIIFVFSFNREFKTNVCLQKCFFVILFFSNLKNVTYMYDQSFFFYKIVFFQFLIDFYNPLKILCFWNPLEIFCF